MKCNFKKGLTNKYIEDFKEKREKYLKSRLGYLDNKNSQRTVEKIEQLVKLKK